MTEITRTHAEWAVVDRLRQMLAETPHAEYSVTQAYGLCVAIVAWVVQRIRTKEFPNNSPEDRVAIALKRRLQSQDPAVLSAGLKSSGVGVGRRDLEGMTAFSFLVWLRNAYCHGDARQVVPVNDGGSLVGFEFRYTSEGEQPRHIVLDGRDLRSIGVTLATMFCEQLQTAVASQPSGFIEDARSMRELRRAA